MSTLLFSHMGAKVKHQVLIPCCGMEGTACANLRKRVSAVNTPILFCAAHAASIHDYNYNIMSDCNLDLQWTHPQTTLLRKQQQSSRSYIPVDDVSTSIEVESPILRMLPLP